MKTSRKKFTQRSKQLKKHAKRFAAYSAAAAATVLTTGDRSANAAEVVHDILDIAINASTNGGYGPAFNIQTRATYYPAGTSSSSPGYYNFVEGNFRVGPGWIYGPAYTTNPTSTGLGFLGTAATDPNYGAYADAYPILAGNEIKSTYTWATQNGGTGTVPLQMYPGPGYYNNFYAEIDFYNNQTAFVGIRFKLNDGTTSHFGWAQITRIDGTNFILHGFGYDDTPGAFSLPTDTVELFGDLNFDDVVDPNDWVLMRESGGTLLPTPVTQDDLFAAYALGDLDRNGTNDIHDFDLFREAYETENGGGSFAAMLAASAVPEPSSILLLAAGAAGLGMWRKRRAG